MSEAEDSGGGGSLIRRHLAFGWTSLLLFAGLGFVLEMLHGFKIPFYLDLANETRRLMWTLAHAHGTLLSLVNLAFASMLREYRAGEPPRLASRALIAATLTMPLGFFLGGLVTHGGDPGYGIALVAPGGVLLLVAVGLVALHTRRG